MQERKTRGEKWSVTELGRAHEGVLASELWGVDTGKPIPDLRVLELGQAVPVTGSPYHPVSQKMVPSCFYPWVP